MKGGTLAMSQKERSRLVVMSRGRRRQWLLGSIRDNGSKLAANLTDIQTVCERWR